MIEKGIQQKFDIQVIKGVSIPEREDYERVSREQSKEAKFSEDRRKDGRNSAKTSSSRKPNHNRMKGNSDTPTKGRKRTR